MKWCCSAYEGNFENAGMRGLAVFADESDSQLKFILQFRAADSGIELKTSQLDQPVSLVTDSVIQYCPWCGSKLSEVYRDQIEDIVKKNLRVPLPDF